MKVSEKPVVVCLTPVKNEAWIIERFLQCASLWADHIILADQRSEDETTAIASRFPKVQIIKNNSKAFNEPERQRLLFEEAQKIKGKKLLIALDADECLSANFLSSSEWTNILNANPGTSISFDLVNIAPGFSYFWKQPNFIRGFMVQDSIDFSPERPIHTEKLPKPNKGRIIKCHDLKLLHYQYTDWKRMKSKHRWYQIWEVINFPEKNPIGLYRMYHHMHAVSKQQLLPLDNAWFKGYVDAGIDMFSIKKGASYYWDDVVMGYFKEYGTNRFSKTAIWDKQWKGYPDPRTGWEKLVHRYLKKTQKYHRLLLIRIIDSFLYRMFK